MQLCVNSDVAYLVMPGAKSCIAGHFYLVSISNLLNHNSTLHNASVHTECIDLKHIVCLMAEAECNGIFHNAQTVMALCYILAALCHQQKTARVNLTTRQLIVCACNHAC
eukprot:14559874-Ditylum_brightwellii.AAC.1